MSSRRRGFTLIEIVVAMTLTLAVFAITLPFVRAQTRALGVSAGRLDADQLARYAQRAIDRDLRLASAVPGQPLIVYAGPMGIAFNANLFASDTTDPGAADVEAGAPTTLTESWRLADAAVIPKTARSYPSQDYLDDDGVVSHNETISYFLHPDTISGRSDIYVLYRRVNARDSVQVVRGLHVPTDSSFFSYSRPVGGVLTRFAAARLPLFWDSVAVDSVRSVGIRSAGYYRDKTTGNETIRTVQWSSVLPNATNRLERSCGAAPGVPSTFSLLKISAGGMFRVRINWGASTDEMSGATDVRYYIVERRVTGGGETWRTVTTAPARKIGAYVWDHELPRDTGSFDYAVRAVDCAGTLSARPTPVVVSFP